MICSAVDEAWNSSEWIFFIESTTDQHLLSITYHSIVQSALTMHISNIYRAPQMGYLEGKGGRYVSRRSISEAKSLMFVLRRPTMSSPTCVSPSWAGRRRSGPSSRWGLWARASPSGTSRGSSASVTIIDNEDGEVTHKHVTNVSFPGFPP